MIQNKFYPICFFSILTIGFLSLNDLARGQTAGPKPGTSKWVESAKTHVYPKVGGSYSLVTWDTLSNFDCGDTPDTEEKIDAKLQAKMKRLVPAFITDLNQKPVAVVGFMLPMDMDDKGENTTGFIMCRTQSACCYGIMPKLNEWIYVTMLKGRSSQVWMDIPVTAFGTLDVGLESDPENGTSFYRMTGEKMGYPDKSLW